MTRTVIRTMIICSVVGFAAEVEAKSTLRIEVREPDKSRLVSADVWIRTPSGKLLRKVYASAGRAQIAELPSGSLVLELRARVGNLYAKTTVNAQPNRLMKVAVKLRPGPKLQTASTAKPSKPNPRTARASSPTGRKKTRQLSTARRRSSGGVVRASSDRRATSTVAGIRKKSPGTATATKAAIRDFGSGKRRVCRGDVLDSRGRRISGRVTIERGTQMLGFARVTSGYFSLYDLSPGSYRIHFAATSGNQTASATVSIALNRLPKVILRPR